MRRNPSEQGDEGGSEDAGLSKQKGGPSSQMRHNRGDDGGGGSGSTTAAVGISFAAEFGEEMRVEAD